MNNLNQEYHSPEVEVIEVQVEQGFATSGESFNENQWNV